MNDLENAFLEAKSRRFIERYEQVVAETGMMLVPFLRTNNQGIFPDIACVPKNLVDKKPRTEENKENEEESTKEWIPDTPEEAEH